MCRAGGWGRLVQPKLHPQGDGQAILVEAGMALVQLL